MEIKANDGKGQSNSYEGGSAASQSREGQEEDQNKQMEYLQEPPLG